MVFSCLREKGTIKSKRFTMEKLVQDQNVYSFYYCNSTFVSPFYTFSMAGNITVYMSIQDTNGEKYFNLYFQGRKGQLRRELITIPSIFHAIDCVFSIFRQKIVWVFSVRNEHPSAYSRADTINDYLNKRPESFSIRGKYKKMH